MALRITGVLPPILPAKTHTGASRRSWQFVLFQQDFIASHFTKAGPCFSCGKVNSNYPILPHGVVGLCVRAHNRQSAIPFLQTNKKYYMFASISRLKNCGAAEPIAPCPVLNISIYTIAHLQATHIRAARKSTDYFCAQNSPCLRGTAGQPHTPQNREYAKARITTSSVKAHPL